MTTEDATSRVDAARVRREVEAVLDRQLAAWSRGDIEALVATYLPSDDVRYASGAKVLRGVEQIRAGFRAAYPDRAAMGDLEFSHIETAALSASDALMFGQWVITRHSGVLRGLFSLHVRHTGQEWLVVSDHTSSEG
ncbi:MAG: hypothetical protein JWQ45_3472 [Blastococcus sp.]|jgi:uncharacterized protein (TIGR02246 family)|nr:hypothetical protein [Blastococcus sp.]